MGLRRINIDIAAKGRKKHKNKISGLVISMCYHERKIKFFTNPSILDTRIYPIKTSVKRTLLGRSKRQEKNTGDEKGRILNIKYLVGNRGWHVLMR